MTDPVADFAPCLVAVIRFVVEEACQPGIHANAADLLHVFLTRDVTVSVDPDRADQYIRIRRAVLICAFVGMMPDISGIFAVTDLHIVHPAPDIFVITGVGDIHTAVEIHDSDFLSSHCVSSSV